VSIRILVLYLKSATSWLLLGW